MDLAPAEGTLALDLPDVIDALLDLADHRHARVDQQQQTDLGDPHDQGDQIADYGRVTSGLELHFVTVPGNQQPDLGLTAMQPVLLDLIE